MKAIETRYNGHRFRSRTEARWAVLFDHLGVKYEYEAEGFELGDGVRYLPDFYMPAEDCYFEIKGDEPTEDELHKAGLLAFATGRFVNVLIGAPGKHDLWVIRPARRPDPELLAWIEMAPTDWLRKRTASELRERGVAIPPSLGFFGDRLLKDHRYAIRGELRHGTKDVHYALDFCDQSGHLALWTAYIASDYGPEYFDKRYRLYDIQHGPARVWCHFQTMNLPYDAQPQRHYGAFDEIRFSPALYAAVDAAKSARFEFGESGAG